MIYRPDHDIKNVIVVIQAIKCHGKMIVSEAQELRNCSLFSVIYQLMAISDCELGVLSVIVKNAICPVFHTLIVFVKLHFSPLYISEIVHRIDRFSILFHSKIHIGSLNSIVSGHLSNCSKCFSCLKHIAFTAG